jgi:hypothetical protein
MAESTVAEAEAEPTANREPLSKKVKHAINCIQRPPAEYVADLKNNLQQKVQNARQTAVDLVKGTFEQVKECGQGLPGVADGVGKSIRQHISGAAQDLIDHINNISTALRNIPNLAEPVRFKIRSTQQMLAEMRDMSLMFSKIVTSPDFKKILKEMGNNYTDGLLQTLDNLQPMIDKLTLKGDAMLKEVGERTGQTVGNAISNALKAIIGEIPAVGGLITGFISLGDLSNKAIKLCEPIVQFGVDAAGVANVAADKYDDLKCKWLELQKKTQPLIDKYQAVQGAAQGAVQGAVQGASDKQSGGMRSGYGGMRSGGMRSRRNDQRSRTLYHTLRKQVRRTQQRLKTWKRLFAKKGATKRGPK